MGINSQDVFARIKSLGQLCCGLYLGVFLFLLAVLTFANIVGIPFDAFSRDPVQVMGGKLYMGSISFLGIMLWSATAAVCIFAIMMSRRTGKSPLFSFLLHASVVTTILLFDDAFLLHEQLLPDYLHIPQSVIYGMYLILILSFLLWNRQTILRSADTLLLATALLFFGLSILIDLIPEEALAYHIFMEDGFKLMGIVGWCVFFVRSSRELIEQSVLSQEHIQIRENPFRRAA